MSISLDKFRAKLVIKILYAHSPEETDRFIRVAIKAMKDRKVNGYITSRFIDKIINQLNNYSSSGTASIKWKNITTAKSSLQKMKDIINAVAA